MNWTLFIGGIMVILLVWVDVLYTSFSVRGAGFITAATTKATWNTLVATSHNSVKKKMLSNAGLIIICQTLLQWIFILWLGHLLMATAQNNSLIQSQTKVPASLLEKIYVVGYTLTTMGNGDFSGSTPWWKFFLSLTALNGMLIFTVALSYLIQVLPRVNSKREFANSVSAVGTNPINFLQNSWTGESFSSLDLLLQGWNNQITALAQSHLSYPILHFYFSHDRRASLPVMLCVLDEALSILQLAVPKQQRPNAVLLKSTRNAIYSLLTTVQHAFAPAAEQVPQPPDLTPLRNSAIPLEDEAEIASRQNKQSQRRQLLLGLLHDEGRNWQEVMDSR